MEAILEREASFCDGEQNQTIVATLHTQKQAMVFCDVIMKVCGKDIHAHSNVLAAASPYFNTFLSQGLPRHYSQRAPQLIEIQIDGSEPSVLYEEAVTVVIDYIYTGRLAVRESNAAQIAEIARIMQMNKIVKFCEDFLSGVTLKSDVCQVQDGQGSRKVMVDAAMNTVVSGVDITVMKTVQPSVHVEPQLPKLRTKNLVSVSTQVLPYLLGLAPDPGDSTVDKCVKATSTEGLLAYPWSSIQYKSAEQPETQLENVSPIATSRACPALKKGPGRPRKALQSPESQPAAKKVKADVHPDVRTEPDAEVTAKSPKNKEQQGAHEDVPGVSLPVAMRRGSHLSSTEEVADDEAQTEAAEAPGELAEAPDPLLQTTTIQPESIKTEGSIALRRGRRSVRPTPKMSDFAGAFRSFLQQPIKKEKDENLSEADENNEAVAATEAAASSQVTEEPLAEIENEISHTEFLEYVMEENETRTSRHANLVEVGAEELVGQPLKLKKRGRGRPRKNRYDEDLMQIGKYQCDSCEFMTNRVREMANHRKLHKLAVNTCYYCDEKFDDKDTLTDHMERHKGPQPFFCPTCNMRFKTRTQLNLHLPKHSDDRPFICEICCQGFKWKHALKNHMVTHSNRKDHLCDFCGYATAHKSQLKAHKLIHTGQTFKCPHPGCTFQATKQQNMKYHMVTHSRERPHQCEVCGQNFSLVKNMKRHMLLHLTDKNHKCQKCSFASTRFDKLKEHLLKQHSIGTPPEKRMLVADIIKQDQMLLPSAGGFKKEPKEESDQDQSNMGQEQGVEAIPENYQWVQVISADGVTREQLVTELQPILMTSGDAITNIIIPQSDGTETVLQPQPVEEGSVASEVAAVQTAQVLESCDAVEGQILPPSEEGEAVIVTQAEGADYAGYTEVMIPTAQMSGYVSPLVSQAEESGET